MSGWPPDLRIIGRREKPHAGAQLSLFEERDGRGYQLTTQRDRNTRFEWLSSAGGRKLVSLFRSDSFGCKGSNQFILRGFCLINHASHIRFGLQAGVFTRDIQLAFRASAQLEVGGVIIGDMPSDRADQMPYGGIKNSGVGREGLRSAMDDFTEPRVLVLTEV